MILGAFVLSILFFSKSLFVEGNIISSPDGSYLGRTVIHNSLKNGYLSGWYNDFGLGTTANSPTPNLWLFLLKFFNPTVSLTLFYIIIISVSLIFCYLFLRKLKLTIIASIFGALTYSFAPNFITLIHAGHILAVSIMMYIPIVLYFLSILFRKEKISTYKIISLSVLTGASWGIMLANDPQRSLYFSIVFCIYILYMLIQKYNMKIKTFLKDIKNKKIYLDLIKLIIIVLVIAPILYNGFHKFENLIKQRSSIETAKTKLSAEMLRKKQWEFSTSYSMHPKDLIDALAFGYHGRFGKYTALPYWNEAPYWGHMSNVNSFGLPTVIILLFAFIGLITLYKKEHLVRIFFWISIVALLLSFGKNLPGRPLYWLWFHLPMMNKFRVPAKFLSVVSFALSILAAFGLNNLIKIVLNKPKKIKIHLKNIIIGLSAFLIIGAIWWIVLYIQTPKLVSKYVSIFKFDVNNAKQIVLNMKIAVGRMILFVAISAGIFLSFYKAKHKNKYIGFLSLAFILILIADLWSINLYYINKSYINPPEFYKADGVVDFLVKEKNLYRTTYSFNVYDNNKTVRLPLLGGLWIDYQRYIFPYHNINLFDKQNISGADTDYNKFLRIKTANKTEITNYNRTIDNNIRLLQLANIKYLITDGWLYRWPIDKAPIKYFHILTNNTKIKKVKTVKNIYRRTNATVHIFEIKNTLPRIGFFENYISVKSNSLSLAYLTNKSHDIQTSVILEDDFDSKLSSSQKVVLQKPEIYNRNYIKLSVNQQKNGVLLHTMRYHPNWKAFIDGKPTKIYKANFVQQGIRVPAGKHVVEFQFITKNTSFYISLSIIIIALVLGLILIIIEIFENNKLNKLSINKN